MPKPEKLQAAAVKTQITHQAPAQNIKFPNQSTSQLKWRLEKYPLVIGLKPTKKQASAFFKKCAIEDLEEQLGRKATREEKRFYLTAVYKFIWVKPLEKFLKWAGPPF